MADIRLIDANALKVRMFRSNEFNRDTGSFDLPVVPWHDIEDADTIDAVPVVHGRWVETGKVFVHSMYDLFTECSLCSFRHVRNEYQEPYHYCPNCGAKMDAEE